jgi:hypothetical protein
VRRLLILVGLILLVPPVLSAQGQRTSSVVLKFKIIQQATFRHPHPPDGDAGDGFSTTLILINIGDQFGKPTGRRVGTMTFAYTLSGACGADSPGCRGTTNIQTFSKLPGGTITADGTKVPLGVRPFVVHVLKGTGTFKGATGSVAIAPFFQSTETYTLSVP